MTGFYSDTSDPKYDCTPAEMAERASVARDAEVLRLRAALRAIATMEPYYIVTGYSYLAMRMKQCAREALSAPALASSLPAPLPAPPEKTT